MTQAIDRRSATERLRTLGITRSYPLVSAVLVVIMAVQTLNHQWSVDWFQHAATVRELSLRPLHPHHPLIGTADLDPDSSPYLLVLGLAVRVSHLSVVTVLAVAGMANLVAFLALLPRFVRCFSPHRETASWSLVFVMVLWGFVPWRWSGYLDLNSIGFGLPYPSMTAVVLAMLVIILLDGWCRSPGLTRALGAGAVLGIAALVNPPSTVGIGIAVITVLLWRWTSTASGAWWHLVGAAGVILALFATWPLYHFFSLLTHTGAYDASGRRMYNLAAPRSLLLLLTLPALATRWRHDRRDALVLLAVSATIVFVGGGVLGHYAVGRALPFAALAGQVALADDISRRIENGSRRAFLVAAAVAAVGLAGCSPVLLRFVPRTMLPTSLASRRELADITKRYRFLRVVPRDDVVAVQNSRERTPEAAFGGKTVSPGSPVAFVHDATRRDHDEGALFKISRPAARREILERYGVQWLLVAPRFADDAVNRPLVSLGRVVHRDHRFVLIRLRHP